MSIKLKNTHINDTPKGKLKEYLIGDLGPARRLLSRLMDKTSGGTQRMFEESIDSIERCIARIERDVPFDPLDD
jgi:hypothetical protein